MQKEQKKSLVTNREWDTGLLQPFCGKSHMLSVEFFKGKLESTQKKPTRGLFLSDCRKFLSVATTLVN